MNKVVIVGCGNVGMAYAYALVISGASVDELVLIDIDKNKASGEMLDLYHASTYAPKNIKIICGDYNDCGNANIVCIAAGVGQKVGETRRDLLSRNINVFKSIIGEISKTKFNGVYLVATNPLDVLTYATMKLSGFKPNKVIGTGTTLDTARLKFEIGQKLKISPKEVHAYVLGEHGDSEFVAWGNATLGGNLCKDYLTTGQMAEIENRVKNSAYEIISKKGNTSYGIGMCLLKITNAILHNQKTIMTVSSYDKKLNCYYSKPTVVGKNGVEKNLSINLNKSDDDKLNNSIFRIKNDIEAIKIELV